MARKCHVPQSLAAVSLLPQTEWVLIKIYLDKKYKKLDILKYVPFSEINPLRDYIFMSSVLGSGATQWHLTAPGSVVWSVCVGLWMVFWFWWVASMLSSQFQKHADRWLGYSKFLLVWMIVWLCMFMAVSNGLVTYLGCIHTSLSASRICFGSTMSRIRIERLLTMKEWALNSVSYQMWQCSYCGTE